MNTDVQQRRPRRRWSRSRTYIVAAVIFALISAAGYVAFRSYIYGDDAPPIPIVDDLTG